MPDEGTKRRLAATLSADAVGYSRLMAEDEAETIQQIKSCRELIGTRVREYHGRVVDSPGDNILAEFPSALDASQCAVEIQQSLQNRNAHLPDSRKMEFRIGIHLGDVFVEADRSYGDSVNAAARLEALADAGGICVSDVIHRQVSSKLGVPFEDVGSFELKNIPYPIQVYKVLLGNEPHAVHQKPEASFASSGKPAIAVLAFENMSSDPEQEYFSDGIAEDILNGLAKNPNIDVIARTSSFQFKGENRDIRHIGQQLDATHVLEGSVRKSGSRIRVTAKLVKVERGARLWSEQYNRELTDVFEIQDEISGAILKELRIRLTIPGDKPSRTVNMKAYNAYLKGRFYLNQIDLSAALECYEEAVSLDPEYTDAFGALANTHQLYIGIGDDSAESRAPIIRQYVRAALSINQKQTEALMAKASLGFFADRAYQEGIDRYSDLIHENPNSANILIGYSLLLNTIGEHEMSRVAVDRATEIDSLNPMVYANQFHNHLKAKRYTQARQAAEAMQILGSSATLQFSWLSFDEGDAAAIEEQISHDVSDWYSPAWRDIFRAELCYLKGDHDKIKEISSSLLQEQEYLAYHMKAHMALLEGDAERLFEYYRRALFEGEPSAFAQIQEPIYIRRIMPDFRSDARYQRMLKDVGLDEESIAKLKIPPLPF